MLFYLEIQSGLLSAFASPTEAESRLEVVDIENNEFEFCDDLGQRFVGEVLAGGSTFKSGRFRLVPQGLPTRRAVEILVSKARSIDKKILGSFTLEQFKERFGPNQSTDPTLASVTHPAGQGARHP